MKNHISVILPVYNVEKYIAKSIQSILNQTYTNFELLIINDGTTDRSIEIASQFEDARIKIFNKENEGASMARNYGLEKARGEYVYFMDSDDWIESNLLKEAICSLDQETEMLLFNYVVDHLDVSDKLIKQEKIKVPVFAMTGSCDINENILQVLGYVWNKIYKLDFLKENNIHFDKNARLYEDVVFNTKVFSKVKYIHQIDDFLYHYSNRPQMTLVKSYNPKTLGNIILMNKAIADYLGNYNIDFKEKNILLAQNLMIGLRHFINSIFEFNQESNLIKLNRLKSIVNDVYIKKLIPFYKTSSVTDKVYKTLILHKMSLALFMICKIKK